MYITKEENATKRELKKIQLESQIKDQEIEEEKIRKNKEI